MDTILIVLFVLGMLYIGFDYGRLWLKCRRLEETDEDITQVIDYVPVRYVFIGAEECDYCEKLLQMCICAHEKVKSPIKHEAQTNGIRKIVFDNNDEAWYWQYKEGNGEPLAPREIEDYANRLFFDDKLPKETVWDAIEKLGLKNYTVTLGICDERSCK